MRIVFMQGIWRVVILAVFMFPLPDCVAQEPGPIAPSVAVLLEKRYVAVFPDRSKILFVVSQDERVSSRSGDGILERSVGDVLHVSGDTGSDLDLVIRKINRDSFEMDVQNGSIVSGVQHVTMPFSPAWKIAAYRGNVDGLRKILDSGFDVNSKDGVGRTALMVAGSYGHYDAVRLLLEHNAKTVMSRNPARPLYGCLWRSLRSSACWWTMALSFKGAIFTVLRTADMRSLWQFCFVPLLSIPMSKISLA